MEVENVICWLLLTLPKSCDPVVSALESMNIDKLTIEFMKGSLLLDSNIKRKMVMKESKHYIISLCKYKKTYRL